MTSRNIDPKNFIPGCDGYTKASEISSLQKYLKKGITKRDEKLKADDRLLVVPGSLPTEDPRYFPEIELSKHREDIKDIDIPNLPNYKEEITDIEVPELPKDSDKIKDIDIPKLPEDSDKIKDTDIPKLPKGTDDIKDIDVPKLPDGMDNIKDIETPELPDTVYDIIEKEVPLPDNVDKITEKEIKLPDKVDEIEENNVKPYYYRDDFSEPEAPRLPDTKLTINKREVDGLSDYRDNFVDDRYVPLDETKVELDGTDDKDKTIKLETGSEKIHKKEEEEKLDKTRIDLSDSNKNLEELPDYSEKINTKENLELSDYKETINDSTKVKLSDYKEEIEDIDDLKLSNYRDTINDNGEVELSKESEKLNVPDINSLDNTKEKLNIDDSIRLDDSSEKLDVTNISELSKKKEEIRVDQTLPLSNYQEKLTDTYDVSLDTGSEKIAVSEDLELDTESEKIKDTNEVKLSDEKEGLSGTFSDIRLDEGSEKIKDHRTILLDTEAEKLKDTNKVSLDDGYEKLTDTTETKLDNTLEVIKGVPVIDKLSKDKETIRDRRNLELSDYLDKTTVTNNLEELPKPLETIVDTTEVTLDKGSEKIKNADSLDELSGDFEKLPDTSSQNIELDSEFEPLSKGQDVSLDTDYEGLAKPEDVSLDQDYEKLEGQGDISLDTSYEGLKKPDDISLDQEYEKLGGQIDVSLNTGYEGLKKPDDIELSDHREDIKELDSPKLNKENVKLDINDLTELDDDYYLRPSSTNLDFFDTDTKSPLFEEGRLADYGKKTEEPDLLKKSQSTDVPGGWAQEFIDSDIREGFDESGLRRYGKKTEKPDPLNKSQLTEEQGDWVQEFVDSDIQQDNVDWDDSSLRKYGEKTEKPDPLKKSQTTEEQGGWAQEFVDSDIREGFDDSGLRKYGEKTEKPENLGPSQKTEIPGAWEQNFIDSDIREGFDESGLKKYGEETENPSEIDVDPPIDRKNYNENLSKDVKDSEKLGIPKRSFTSEDSTWKPKEVGSVNDYSDDVEHNMTKKDRLGIPMHKIPEGNLGAYMNPSTYLRWVVEQTVGRIPIHGSAKQMLLNETLSTLINARELLESKLHTSPYRLPGDSVTFTSGSTTLNKIKSGISTLTDIASGVDLKNLASTGVSALAKTGQKLASAYLSNASMDIPNPINRPYKDGSYPLYFESKDGDFKRSFIDTLVGTNKILKPYHPDYLKLPDVESSEKQHLPDNAIIGSDAKLGLSGTLYALTNKADAFGPKELSFSELKEALESSDYITTSRKIYGIKGENISSNVMTLDSNHIWEIKFEPYCGIENGERSFLPSIQQINFENYKNFGINTNWNKWTPFTSFELNSKKMTQKSIGLYNGEISIPQNLEFTNELRLVICDDQYKSWKRYFEEVMYASTFLSSSHDYEYYNKKYLDDIKDFKEEDVIRYNKGVVRPAPYKNLAFRCTIYTMNPQYQMINVSDLLVVLKDLTEEWQGEIDASPTELALMFSIVGENPRGLSISTVMNGINDIKSKRTANKSIQTQSSNKSTQSNTTNLPPSVRLPGRDSIYITDRDYKKTSGQIL